MESAGFVMIDELRTGFSGLPRSPVGHRKINPGHHHRSQPPEKGEKTLQFKENRGEEKIQETPSTQKGRGMIGNQSMVVTQLLEGSEGKAGGVIQLRLREREAV